MSNSSGIIDWLTFSLPCYPGEEVYQNTMSVIAYFVPSLAELVAAKKWKETSGRAPYDRSYSSPGWRIFAGVNVSHISVEVSGIGCAELTRLGLVDEVLRSVHERISRIDLALDIETDLSPSDFVDAGYSGRIRSVGSVVSDSGETYYIGSQKSDRYCRVYRYSKPHPRSGLLRIEYVFRRKEAKSVGFMVTKLGIEESIRKANKTYKWEHSIMEDLVSVEGLTATVAHRTSAKTLRWLMTQVAPAFRKLVEEGVIEEPEQFFYKHFMGVNENEG